MLYRDGSSVAVGVGLGGEVLVGVNVGSGVQVGGNSDIAVAFGRIAVADNCGGGARVLSRSQDEVKKITIENKIIRIDFFIIFPERILLVLDQVILDLIDGCSAAS
jgi:hypothetical protein